MSKTVRQSGFEALPTPGGRPARRLRVGLLIDSLIQPAWVYRIVDEIQRSEVAEISLVVLNDAPVSRSPGLPQRLLHNLNYALYAAYQRFDRFWFRDDRPDPFEETSLGPLVADAQLLPLALAAGHGNHGAVLDRIQAQDLDVALRFGFDDLDTRLLDIAKHGVWSSGTRDRSGAPSGFWEVMHGQPVTESVLQIETRDRTKPRVIYRSYSSTMSLVSVWKSRREPYWKAAAFVSRKLRDLSELGSSSLSDVSKAAGNSKLIERRPPTNLALVRVLPRIAARYAAIKVETRIGFNQWSLAYKFDQQGGAEPGVPDATMRDFTQLIPPRDRMWADPFPVIHRGRYYVFLEELLYARNKGHISVMEFEDSQPARPELVLETQHHLSYPFVLQWSGETFLIPESARAGDRPQEIGQTSIPVFRARSFPDDWVQEAAMLEGHEVFDPTIAEIDGTWWLFCTKAEPGASTWDELHVFHAPSPFGPWTAHRRNPVKSDVRSARPAGRLFRRGGHWYRPAQDCSVRYGYAMTINRITRLTPTEYEEVEVTQILPTWAPNLMGTHTLNCVGNLTITDASVRRSRWSSDPAPLRALHRAGRK